MVGRMLQIKILWEYPITGSGNVLVWRAIVLVSGERSQTAKVKENILDSQY